MIVHALIPARGGSKRIPKKNIKLLAGKPLIYHTINQSLNTLLVNKTIVTTDSNEIIQMITQDYQVELLANRLAIMRRPPEISGDLSTDYEFIQHYLSTISTTKNPALAPDMIVHLRPTYPTRKVSLIDELISQLAKNKLYDSVRTVTATTKSPLKTYRILENKLVPLFPTIDLIKEPYNLPTQLLPQTYIHNGCIDVFWTKTFTQKNSISGEYIFPYVMDITETYDIDTEEDFAKVEELFKV